MTEKKHQKHEEKEEQVNEVQAEAVTAPESTDQLKAEMGTLMKRLEEAEAKVAEHLDGWQRAQAEFQNYKKRIERDNESMYLAMKGDIIKKFLPVLDDLERALQTRPENMNGHAWISGIDLICRKLQSILEAEGMKRIEAEGAAFDANLHEAISHETVEGVESGHIIAVVQNGYMLGDRVIRPALVRVAQ